MNPHDKADTAVLLQLAQRCARQAGFTWTLEDDRLDFGEEIKEFLAPGLLNDVRTGADLVARVDPADRRALRDALVDTLKGGSHAAASHGVYEALIRVRSGEARWHWIAMRGNVTATDDAGRATRISGVLVDETQRETERREALRMRDLYAMLGAMNRAIAQSTQPIALLTELCRVAVEHGGFKLAWVARGDRVTGQVDVAAQAGEPRSYADTAARIATTSTLSRGGLVSKVMKARQAEVIHDLRQILDRAAYADAAGFRSMAAFPLFEDGQPCGALLLYATRPHHFDADLTALLEGLSQDVSHALDHLRIKQRQAETNRQLIDAARRFEQLVEHAPDGMLVHIDGKLVLVNAKLRHMLGATCSEQVLGSEMIERLHPDHHPWLAQRIADPDQIRQQPVMTEIKVLRLDGSVIEVDMLSSETEFQGHPARQVVLRDIGERKRAQRQEANRQAVVARIAAREALPTVLMEVARSIEADAPGAFCSVYVSNEAGTEFTAAYSPSRPIGVLKAAAFRVIAADSPSLIARVASTRQPLFVEDAHPSDSTMPRRLRALRRATGARAIGAWPLMTQAGQLMGVITVSLREPGPLRADVAQRVMEYSALTALAIDNDRQAAHIRHLAQHDVLTGLPNRAMFKELLEQALARARREGTQLAAMFIDLDRFKLINDTFGHDAGDAVLRETAGRLKQSVRECDRVARMGGDEFFVLVDNLSGADGAAMLAQRILDRVAQPIPMGGQEHELSASLGIAVFPRDGEDSDMLLKHADIAMYRAKQSGRNGYSFFAEADNIHTTERFELQSQLRRALQRREFFLHYQPRVDLRSGRVRGFEALVRWAHPGRGTIMPGGFIEVAEESGLIVALGLQVMEMAFEAVPHFAARAQAGAAVTMAINLSAVQIASEGFVDQVCSLVARTGVDPRGIEFEITESALMRKPEQARAAIQTLHDLGFRFSIDDFGTGYSSLTYLKRFPVDCVKIDRSFVKDIPGDASDLAISRAIVAMAHSLSLHVVAEGVETPEQLHALRQMNCDQYQGYLFSKPVSIDLALALMESPAVV